MWNTFRTLWKDRKGQDLIEYALIAGFVAFSATTLSPQVMTSMSTIFRKMESVLNRAAAGGG